MEMYLLRQMASKDSDQTVHVHSLIRVVLASVDDCFALYVGFLLFDRSVRWGTMPILIQDLGCMF